MRPALILIALLGAISPFAANAEANEQVGNWFIFQDNGQCVAASEPIQSVDKRNGNVIREKRREGAILVSYTKGERTPRFSYRGDYWLSTASGANWIDINKKKYELFPHTDPDWNWFAYADEEFEPRIIKGIMNGSGVVVVGSSPKGHPFKIENTYSLVGAAQAITRASELCGVKKPQSSPSVSGGAADKPRTQKDSPEK